MRLPRVLQEVLMAKGSRLDRAFALVEETTMSVEREAAAFLAVGAYLRRAHPHVVDPVLGDMLAILKGVEADQGMPPGPPRSGGTPSTGEAPEGSGCDSPPQEGDDAGAA